MRRDRYRVVCSNCGFDEEFAIDERRPSYVAVNEGIMRHHTQPLNACGTGSLELTVTVLERGVEDLRPDPE